MKFLICSDKHSCKCYKYPVSTTHRSYPIRKVLNYSSVKNLMAINFNFNLTKKFIILWCCIFINILRFIRIKFIKNGLLIEIIIPLFNYISSIVKSLFSKLSRNQRNGISKLIFFIYWWIFTIYSHIYYLIN